MIVMGHRGAAGVAPENTLAGFQVSAKLGVPWVELDIRPTRDGELVLLHDKSLERTTDGTGEVNQMTVEEIQKFDAGSWFSKEFTGVRVPTLLEVIDEFHDQLQFNIEAKDDEDRVDEQIARLFEILDKYQLRHRVILSSFKERFLRALREEDERLQLAIIAGQSADQLKRIATELNCQVVNPSLKILSEPLVQWAHERGKKVNAWMANEKEIIHLLAQFKVDYCCSDYPALALECIEEMP